ncbi:MAG TPA: IS21-like element helper ATPase IstB [Chloroflexota bacterium]|nr:IS21-like element helper ATPase IstB [Chloroflexota bacterium]
MVTVDTLQPQLRQLKLSGMREAIAARVEEARGRQLDPLDFLVLLLDDELARRERDAVTRRIQQARFEEVCDLRDFDFTFNPDIPKAKLWGLASGRFIDEHAALLLTGPTGVGKTFVAQALGVAACRQQRRVLFSKTAAFLTDLAGGRADGSWQPRLRRYVTPDLLVLDDFGMREYTTTQAEDLYELVSRRYRQGALILTLNREPKDLYPLFPNPLLAEGLLDRLLNSAYVVTMLGRSYRQRQRPALDDDQPPAGPDSAHDPTPPRAA